MPLFNNTFPSASLRPFQTQNSPAAPQRQTQLGKKALHPKEEGTVMLRQTVKMIFSRARGRSAVHHQPADSEEGDKYANRAPPCTSLTVWRKSLLYGCSGFTVIGSKGSLVYRVDNYCGHPGEIVLMDAHGKPVLSIRHHKKLNLLGDWLVYEGEDHVDDNEKRSSSSTKKKQQQPICCVKKHVNILHAVPSVLADVFLGREDKRPAYVIEGSYLKRSCKVIDKWRNIAAEIRQKETTNGSASFGSEVFQLIVRPGFDAALSMAMVLLLDQMFS
ncbi:hypothetical protein Nepgr_011205 [Nepenthes gracilis]|uniref:Protein LURP-one-related 8 n=1 Tax=Nepenthes gracilis TaxID=150966 RepID=A0AAD3SES9_NEPGR|nr:hypothetical protein Nepgr_011205 [Nepenthes gracilis]